MSRQCITKAIKERRIERAVVPTPAGVKIASPILAMRELLAKSDPAKRDPRLVDTATSLPAPAPLDYVWQEHRGLWEAQLDWLIGATGGKVAPEHVEVLQRLEACLNGVADACMHAGLLTPPESDDEAPGRRNGHRRRSS